MDATQAFLAELERSEEGRTSKKNESLVPAGERPCPICGNKMDVEMMSGAEIDVCPDHGVWLDRGELPKILRRSSSIARPSQVEAIRKARRDGKTSGIIFGVWSLLFD